MEEVKVAEQEKKHIRHYAKALKFAKDYYAKWEREELKPQADETPEQTVKRNRQFQKDCAKAKAKTMARLENADNGYTLREIEAEVNWTKHKGSMGHQCSARVWVSYDHPVHGHASSYAEGPRTTGWGYDKASTALCDAINKLDKDGRASVDRMVIEGGPKVWEEYAVTRRPFPHFEFGGKGMSTFTGLFHRLGCKHYKGDKFAFPKFEIDYRQNDNEDYFIHVIRRDLV